MRLYYAQKTCRFWEKNCSRCSVVIAHTEQQVSKNIEEDGPILKPYTHTFMLLHPRLDPLFSFVQNHKIFCQFLVVDGEFYYFYFFCKKSLWNLIGQIISILNPHSTKILYAHPIIYTML